MPIRKRPVHSAVAGLAAVLACGVGVITPGCQNDTDNDPAGGGRGPMVFEIDGMTCEACVNKLTAAIEELPGVATAKVSLADRQAVVTGDTAELSKEAVIAAVEKAGYKARLAGAGREGVRTDGGPVSKRGVLVNITAGKDDLHAVSMALGLAQHALDDGRDAAVFLNVAAPVFAAKDLPQDVQYADFPPVSKMLADFMDSGGKVYVCRHCSHVCGVEEDELIEGISVTGHTDLFPQLDGGTAVFSY